LVRIRTGYSKAGRPMIVPLQWRGVRPSLSPEARGLEVEADALRGVIVILARVGGAAAAARGLPHS
jgi:hypothetical protein